MNIIDAYILLMLMILLEIPVQFFTELGFEHDIAGNTLLAILFWWLIIYWIRLFVRITCNLIEIVKKQEQKSITGDTLEKSIAK
ncbi:hypothetical protein HY604_00220 [Candidatus Peregrinibacteria bacterium]|nr:hypothetical protein [Candidatus Peregrinibacteria bacterium]